MNRTKTLLLMATLTALLLWAGQALGGQSGLVAALALAAVMNLGAYWFSDSLVLRMHGARETDEDQAPALYHLVRTLAMRADMPMPRVCVIRDETPNAFATGRDPRHAAVVVSEGLLRLLDRGELEGVLAHELAHIRHRDTLIMTVAATMAGALSMLANMAMWAAMVGGGRNAEDGEEGAGPFAGLLGVLIAPFAAMLIQMAISRSREFMADERGSRLTGNPLGLASALRKIEWWSRRIPAETASPATAHLFIINPFSVGGLVRLFSTHPPTEVRIARLEVMHLEGSFLAA
jgi:heat shock protein HtpX